METARRMERFLPRPVFGLVSSWGAGLASAWDMVDGALESFTLICGAAIGVLSVIRLLRELGWIKSRHRSETPP